jgi:transposase
MFSVDMIGRIRRAHFVDGRSFREIARDLKISRNTVRKVLRSGETVFAYEREAQPRRKLGEWQEALDEILVANRGKARREQLTLIRIFETLQERGYTGGYDAVRRYARSWQRREASGPVSAYVPLSFAPGEAYQFDWSHEIVVLDGVTMAVKVA